MWNRWEQSPSLTSSDGFPDAVQEVVGFLCCKSTFSARVQFGVQQHPQASSSKLFFSHLAQGTCRDCIFIEARDKVGDKIEFQKNVEKVKEKY